MSFIRSMGAIKVFAITAAAPPITKSFPNLIAFSEVGHFEDISDSSSILMTMLMKLTKLMKFLLLWNCSHRFFDASKISFEKVEIAKWKAKAINLHKNKSSHHYFAKHGIGIPGKLINWLIDNRWFHKNEFWDSADSECKDS